MDLVHLISIGLVLCLVLIAAFFQLSAMLWSIVIGLGLLLLSILGGLSITAMLLLWPIYLSIAAISNLPTLRRHFIVQPALNLLKKRMPPISETEREAIEAGNTWWEKELFCGRPQWKKLFQWPKPTLSVAEQAFLQNQVETLCKKNKRLGNC